MKGRTPKQVSRRGTMSGATPTDAISPATGFAGKPMDGSQYIDIIEEQEYADRRPTKEEQTPRLANLDEKAQNSGH